MVQSWLDVTFRKQPFNLAMGNQSSEIFFVIVYRLSALDTLIFKPNSFPFLTIGHHYVVYVENGNAAKRKTCSELFGSVFNAVTAPESFLFAC